MREGRGMQNLFSISHDDNVTSLAIGKFDGLHRAHRALFASLGAGGAVLVVQIPKQILSSIAMKQELIPFPIFEVQWESIRDLSGADFFALLMRKFPRLSRVVVGEDFRFGKNRECGAGDIACLFAGEAVVIPEISYHGCPIHTDTICALLQNGEIARANELLGRIYAIEGAVVRGQGLGKKNLIPTLNVCAPDFVQPQSGVYLTYAKLDDLFYRSISFLGNRLSTDNQFAFETHLLAPERGMPHVIENASVYLFESQIPSKMSVYFLQRLRANRKFADLSELRGQIEHDVQQARTLHQAIALPLAREENA